MYQHDIDSEINALKNLLSQTDYQALKFAEGSLSAEEYEEVKEKRQSFRDRINELQEMVPDEEPHVIEVVEE